MEQKQITLEKIYDAIKNMQQELHNINERLDWEHEFTEEENKIFAEGTERAWKEIDEGKYTVYGSSDEFLATFKEENAENKGN